MSEVQKSEKSLWDRVAELEADPAFDPYDYITYLEAPWGTKFDMTGEPWWKVLWFKILRLA